MLSRERVVAVIEHRKPDRIPVYAWLRANLDQQISAQFGSVDAFEDHYEFDFAHLFGGPTPYSETVMKPLREAKGAWIEPRDLLDTTLADVNDHDAYTAIQAGIEHHKHRRSRFVYVQTPGIFECLNRPFGIENHLMYLALYEDELKLVYQRQAEWNRQFAMNCLDLGVDMVHVSDDWGAQNGLLFSPHTWWQLIYPNHKITCDAVRSRGAYLSVHSDGNVRQILDGIVKLGYHVVHPFQESAGMDIQEYLTNYRDDFVLMGGIDIQTTLGFGNYGHLRDEIERIVTTFKDGGLLLCTSHFVQDHCTMEELVFAFDTIRDMVTA